MSYAEHRAKISGTFPAKTSVSSYAEYRKKKDDELITSWLKSAATAQDITNKHLSSSSYGDWSGSSGNVRNRLDAISSQSNEVRAALERNKTSYDAETYKKLTDAVNSYGSYFSAATSGVKRQSEYFSQFGSEDDYNAAIEANKRRQKQSTMTTSDVKKEIESLKTKKDEYKESDDRTKLSDVVGSIFNSKDFSDTKDEYKAGRKKIADYSSQIAEYTNVQKEKEFDDKYGKLINNSTYASKYTPDKTINDEKYKYINDVDGFRNKYAEEVKAAAKSGRFRGGSDYVVYDKLTDKEVSAYNYLYTSQGKKAADEFLDAMQEKYAESVAEDIYTGKLGGGLKGNAAAELGYSVVAGADQFVSGIKGTGKWLNENDEATPTSTAQYVRSMVREDLGDKEQHPILAGKSILGNTVGQTIYDIGTTIANMAPSILAGSLITFATGGLGAPAAIASTVGSAVGAASLGTSAAGNDYNEKIKAGYSPEQAGTHAMLVGASESALQYLLGGVGGVSSKAGSNALKSVLSKSGVEALNKISNVLDNVFVKYLIDAGSEFTEEYLQEVLTPVFDNIVLDDNKEIKLFSEEALYSGILGALTAGAINAPSAISSITENRNTPKADITKQPDAMTTTPPIIEAEDITATTSDVNPVSDVEVTDDTLLTEYSKSFGKYADVFSNSYTQGTDIDTYETEFRKAFNNGRSGTTLDYTKRSNTLLPKQIEAAFTAGQDYAKEQAKMKKDVFSGVKRPGYVKLEEGIKAATLEPKQKASLSAIRSIATVSGVNFEFFQSKPDENGSYANYENGSYDAKTNTIRIDLNAGKYGVNIGDYAILRTASHELTHFIKNNSTEQFKALSDFTVAMLTEFEGKSIEDLVLAKQSNSRRTELSYDDALEEVIADGCEMMLKDSAAVEMLAKENKSLYNSVKNFVKSFVNAVKKAFQGVEANTEEAKAMMKYADALQVVWDNALVQSVRNYNASEPSQVEQGKKFSMRNSEEETDKLVAVHNLTEKNLLDSLELGGLPMPSVAIVKARQGHTKYGEISLVFNKNAIDPAVLKSNKIYGYGKATEDTVTDIIELVQNISSMPTEYFEAKPRRAVYFKEVAAAIIPDNSSDNLKSKLNNIKIPVVEYSANNEESRLEALNSVEGVKFSERDSEYLELAKDPEKNESKLRDMVDDVAKAAGYTIKAYHGTKKDFNIFDIGKNTNNTMLGRGFYFAKDPDVVQRYGNRKISAYLKLSNPLNISGVNLNSVLYALRNSVSGTVDVNLMLSDGRYANGVNTKKLTEFIKSNGYDGISENTKGYYVVFDSDQIKSADPVTYDNSGKVIPLSVRFNSNSKDIRYSERDSEKRLIYGNAEGQMYEISETDKYRMTGTKHGSVLMVPQNNTDSVKIYGVMRTSGFVNGAYVGDENINTLFSNGRIVMNNDSYNNNTRAKVTSIIKREISMLGGTYSSGTYYRVTDNPKEIELLKSGKIKKSINHMNGKEENGLSVWEIPKYTGKYIYRVSGDVTTIGSDHEPVLDISSVKFVEEVDFKKLRRDDASGKDLFSKIYNWSFRQIDNAIDGIYEKSELKYQDRTPEYTNRQILVNALENDNLSDEGKAEAINALKSRLNLTDGRDIDADTVNTIAGNLLKSYKSKYGVDRLQSDLSELYGGVSDNVSWDEMLKKSELIASNILKNSTAKNDDIQYTKEILGVIRKTPIRLSSTQEQEAAFSVGGTINDFRKKNFGNFIISKDGIPLDTWWNQLSEMYPDVFDSDVTEGDQITSLADICEMLRTPQDISSDIVADVGKKILSGALEFPEYTNRFILSNALSHIDGLSVADQNRLNIYKKDLDKLNGYETELSEVKKQIHDIAFTKGTDRTRLKALYQRADTLRSAIKDADKTLLRVEAMEPIKKLVESERKEIDKRITADSKQRLSDYRDKATIEKINKKVKSLADRLVTNSAKSNIPDILKEPVAELVMSIDPSSKKLLEKSISTKKDRSFAKVLDGVRRAMNNLDGQNTTAKEVYGAYMDLPDGFVEQLDLFVLGVEGIVESYTDVNPTSVLNQMTAEQLKELNSMLTVINKAISQLGKTVASKRFEYIDDMRQPTMTHLDSLGEGEINSFLEADNLLPFYFFKRLGEGGKAIFESLQDGWDTLSFNAQKIIEFTQKTYTPQEVKVWENDVHTFKDSDNKEFKMTTAQIMSLYCLARREQGIGHILGGGIRIGTFETKDSKLGKAQKFKQSDNYHLSIENAQEIIGTLTDRQRKVAEQLQGFMSSDCAEWGNFVSTKRFGIRLFLEKFYFPIEVVKSDVKIGDEIKRGDGMYSLLNISSTKETIIGANNALVLRNAFDVFANHTADMAKYNALGLPLLDAMKWYGTIDRSKNEDGRVYTRSVRASLEKAYGNPALNYFTQFIKDLNGADEGGRDSGFWKKLISNYKVSKVAANLRVAVLQPVAYVRATTAIDAKYLLRATKNIKDTKSLVKEMETKSGIGGWKSLGFFDTDISRGLREIIKNDVDVTEKIKDKSMKLAEWGDKITWGLLYKACKYEALDKGLGGAALDEYAGNRFREVVYSTQVVDSTMTRSHIMRSRSTFTSMATAFMSEPTMSYNLLLDAYNDVSTDKKQGMSLAQSMKKHGGAIRSLATTYCLTATVTAVVEALIDAARDDDDDEYIKKFASELGWNLLDSLSIVNKIPFVKEVRNAILSLIKGYTYSTSRTDVAWLSELSQAISYAKSYFSGDSNMTQYGVTYKLITAVSSVVGLPLGSVMRDVVTVWNNTAGALSPDLKIRRYEQTAVKKAAALDKTEDVKAYIQTLIVEKSEERQQDYPGETATEREKAVTSSVKSTVTSYYKSLYVSAQLVGDTKEMGRIRSKLIQTGLYDDVDKTLSGWLEASKETARKKGVE